MTAVSQRVSNFLGGVSQQADEKMFPGQVRDALNCYPDTTLGMIKRPGGKYLGMLASTTPLTSDKNKWFTVFRDELEQYVANVASDGSIRVWNLKTGAAVPLTYSAGKEATIKSYLATVGKDDNGVALPWDHYNVKTLTVNDLTYLLNTQVAVEAQPAPTFVKNKQATISVLSVNYATEYKVVIGTTEYVFTTRSDYAVSPAPDQPAPEVKPLKLSEVVDGLFDKITSGYTTKVKVDNTIHLTFDAETTVTATAGPDGKSLRVFQDTVDNFNRLPEQSIHGRVVKVANTASDKDDFYLQFVADNGTSGVGHWVETRSPAASPGIKPETMPIALIRKADGSFLAALIDGSEKINDLSLTWESRLVGDEDSNKHPSFVGHRIQDLFLFANRLGFLTEDNVSMSQAGDFYNFYHVSATTQTAGDPIDLSCSSIKPAVVHTVVPIAQGLLLFSRSQQFLMEAENGVWTPASTSIRALASYECDPYIYPTNLGSTVMFVSKNPNWTRSFEIFTRGQRESPSVSESTKHVPEWLPSTITRAIGSSQNGLWIGSDRESSYIYLFRFYEEGDERKLASWVRWKMFGNVIHTDIQNDVLYALVSDDKGYTMCAYPLVLSPSSGGLVNSLGNVVDPALDAWSEITTPVTSNGRITRVDLPDNYSSNIPLRFVVGTSKARTGAFFSGITGELEVQTDANGRYFEIPGDVTSSHIYIGYRYTMELVLPRYQYSDGDNGYDFTGYTTTARMKFYTGLGGAVYFQIKDNTREEWKDTTGAIIADSYVADTSPFKEHYVYKVPVYQRPANYTMKVISENPFPVSLVAMQWEGQYSPGFYRRS